MALGDAIDPRYKALVLLAGFGGLRRGELLGLRRGDIDVLHRTVEVERQAIQMNSGERLVSAPKTVAGIRKVHVPSLVADVLADHLANFVPPEADA
jgi:integrase